MKPDESWLALWERCREDLECPAPLEAYFDNSDEEYLLISGKRPQTLSFGEITLSTGRVFVRDPLLDLDMNTAPFFLEVPPGTYAVTAAVIRREEDQPLYAAVRVCFSDAAAVRYEEALTGEEDLRALAEEDYFGFDVDSGFSCICDENTQQSYCTFVERWNASHPGSNFKEAYIEPLFSQKLTNPGKRESPGGDWVDWVIPETACHMLLFRSGFGAGTYPVYFGWDKNEQICQIVLQFNDLQPDRGNAEEQLRLRDFERVGSLCGGSIQMEGWNQYFGIHRPCALFFTVPAQGPLTGFTPLQNAGYAYLLSHQIELADSILSALLSGYTDMQAEYGYEDEEKEDLMPDVREKEGFAELLTPSSIHVHPIEYNGIPYIGYVFSCPWDEKHGFGAILHGLRVVQIGGADAALSTEIAKKDLARRRKNG